MIRTLALVAIVAAMVTPAEARPVRDFQCGKDRITAWTDKSKRPFQPSYSLLGRGNKEIRYLPSRLFKHNGDNLFYQGGQCRPIELTESD
jgi:hypothetical protein